MNITADTFGPLAAQNMMKETAVRNTKDSHRSLTTKTITTSGQKDTGRDVPLSWNSDRGSEPTQLGLMPLAEKESRQRSLPHRLRAERRPPKDSRILTLLSNLAQKLNSPPGRTSLGDLTIEFTESSGQSSVEQFVGGSTPPSTESESVSQSGSWTEGARQTDNSTQQVIIYVRVSTNEQASEGRSLEGQKDELRSIVAESDSMELYCDPIEDDGISGTDFDREGIQRVAEIVQQENISHLLVDDIDRIGRTIPETMMFIQRLRDQHGVKIRTRTVEFDVVKVPDRMRVAVLALMADIGTRNRARSSRRSSARGFIESKQWNSWYHGVPLGYESTDDGWIRVKEELRPVITDLFKSFVRKEQYAAVAKKINRGYGSKLEKPLTSQRVKRLLTRPVYIGKPAIPVKNLENYDPNPEVDDPSLQMISEDLFERTQSRVQSIADKHSTDTGVTSEPEDFIEEFDPGILEVTSPLVQLLCPSCGSEMVADGQYTLEQGVASHIYECTSDDCNYHRQWPRKDEYERMKMLKKIDEYKDIL